MADAATLRKPAPFTARPVEYRVDPRGGPVPTSMACRLSPGIPAVPVVPGPLTPRTVPVGGSRSVNHTSPQPGLTPPSTATETSGRLRWHRQRLTQLISGAHRCAEHDSRLTHERRLLVTRSANIWSLAVPAPRGTSAPDGGGGRSEKAARSCSQGCRQLGPRYLFARQRRADKRC